MRILLTNVTLGGRTGTEVVTRDLAVGLARRGHDVTVFSPDHGPLAAEIAAGGVPVVRSLREVAAPPDVIHGHHHAVTVEALVAFPRANALFVCHDRLATTDVPPLHRRVLRYVAVDANTAERLEAHGIPEASRSTVLNAVDLERFLPRPPLPAAPLRALVFSNAAGRLFSVAPIREACAARGIALDVAGAGSDADCEEPWKTLRGYDLVFAKARAALEALAVGCAVVLCDYRGLGEIVTPEAFPRMRPWNFGMRLLTRPLDVAAVGAEIDRYDPDAAAAVRDLARAEAGLDAALDRWEGIYRELLEAALPPADPLEELRAYLDRLLAVSVGDRDLPKAYRMERLADRELEGISLLPGAAPSRVRAGERFQLTAVLENRFGPRLASEMPHPVHVSYHWVDPETGSIAIMDGVRSRIDPGVEPGDSRVVRVVVDAPSAPGRWRLRVAVVQEFVAWLDERSPRLGFDLDVEVEAPPEAGLGGPAQVEGCG